MRRLYLVGYSAEQGGFVLATRRGAKSGTYVVEVDGAVLNDMERARRIATGRPEPGRGTNGAGSQSALSPREIQAQLRSGRSMEEVAADAGVGVDWIDRFAGPVMAELGACIDRAARALLHTPRHGPSDRPLEASVLRNLASRGIVMGQQEFDSAWSARHLVDTEWCIVFRFRSRGRDLAAEWTFDSGTGGLSARNRLGGEMGFVGPDGGPVGRLDAAPTAVDPPAAQLPLADLLPPPAGETRPGRQG